MDSVAEGLGGIWAPTCTPLNADQKIDPDLLTEHLDRLIDAGCRGIVLFGTTGEATSFSVEERKAALEAVLAGGRDPDQLIVGTGCASIEDSVALTRHAVANGCPKVLVLPPFFYKGVSDEGLFASYATIIEAANNDSLRVFLYHIPQYSTVPIPHAVILRLQSEYGYAVAGLKDSSGDTDGTKGFIEAFPTLDIFPGNELTMLSLLNKGAMGCITATANVNAVQIRSVYDLWKDGDSGATAMQTRISRFREVIDAYPRIPALKHLIGRSLNDDSWSNIRPPLTSLGSDRVGELEAAVSMLR